MLRNTKPARNTYTMSAAEQRAPGAPFTPAERAKRRETLGASEIAAVAGMSKYTSAMDVYLEKIGEAPDYQDPDLAEFAEWGHRMEDVVAAKYAAVHGVQVVPSWSHRGMDEADLASCTPDRTVHNAGDLRTVLRGLEIKNRSEYLLSDFGDNGSDEVPDDIAAQCHYSMAVVRTHAAFENVGQWDVAVLIGGNKFRWYRLEYDRDLSDGLLDIGRAFMVNNVAARVPPELGASAKTKAWLEEKFRIYSEVMLAADPEIHKLILDRVQVDKELKALESRKEYLDTELKHFIGSATGVTGPNWYATWKTRAGKVALADLVRELNPPAALVEKHRGAPYRQIYVNTNKLK